MRVEPHWLQEGLFIAVFFDNNSIIIEGERGVKMYFSGQGPRLSRRKGYDRGSGGWRLTGHL